MTTVRPIPLFIVPVVALLGACVACERTAEGLKQDTAAAAQTVNDKGAQAEQELETEMSEFKAKTQAKLDELTVSIASLQAKAESGLDKSKAELQTQIDQTKSELSKLKADSRDELQRAKSSLDARIADFGKRVNGTLDEVGNDLDVAGDRVEKKLE